MNKNIFATSIAVGGLACLMGCSQQPAAPPAPEPPPPEASAPAPAAAEAAPAAAPAAADAPAVGSQGDGEVIKKN